MSVTQKSYRVLVADDHAVVRSGLKHLLEEQPGVEVCCEATTGVEAVENVKKTKPDMILLDLTMPDMNGLDAARQIREASPNTDILILSMHYTEEIAREVLRSGARGYMLKSDANAELITAVKPGASWRAVFHGIARCHDGGKLCANESQWFGRLRDRRHTAYAARGRNHPVTGARKGV